MVRYLNELIPLLKTFYQMRDEYFKDGNSLGYHETLEDIRDLEKEVVESAIQEHTYFEGDK